MPAIFATRDDTEFKNQMEDWIALTTERDALQIPMKTVESSKLQRILREIVLINEPESGRIAKALRMSPLTVKSYIQVLEALFVIHRIDPHPLSTGKARYYLCDPGICAVLGGSFERCLETAFYVETLAKRSYLGLEASTPLTYFRSTKGSVVHGIWENGRAVSLLKLLPDETVDDRETFILNSLSKKMGESGLTVKSAYLLSGARDPEKIGKIQVLPWESLS